MRLTLTGALLALSAAQVLAASAWGFSDATVTVSAKGAGVGSGTKNELAMEKPLAKAIQLGPTDTLKILLTAKDGKTAKRPHQAFLSIADEAGLETSFPLSVKDNGKAKVDLTWNDIPSQLLHSTSPLSASIVIGSFGSSKPYSSAAFNLNIARDPASPEPAAPSPPERYGKLPEIHHVFRGDPKSPPTVITLFFTAIVLAALPGLLVAWLMLGGNLNHLPAALGASPVGHALYFGAIVAMQAVFFLYYTAWNLFQTLPAAMVIGAVILFAGSRALTEVQERRLKAQR